MSVTVYTTPNCVQCNATKKHLERIGIDYETVDLSENPDTLKEFVDKGFSTAPIVVAGENIWSGYQHSKIESLKA